MASESVDERASVGPVAAGRPRRAGSAVPTPLILIAEDEPGQVEVIAYNLKMAGFHVAVADNGERALALAEELEPDLIILDWMLPEVSGLEVCRRLKAQPRTRRVPVLILTARAEERDRIRGLEAGADDYMVKPHSSAEMIARIRTIFRRTRPVLVDERLTFAGIVLELAEHRVSRDGQPVHLSPTEFRLLLTLMERPGEVFSRERLLNLVWGRDTHVDDRTVDVHIRRLRKALGAGVRGVIRTVRGAGYALDDRAELATAPTGS
jgi:two-component system phosphate regulon response regulator PhoB